MPNINTTALSTPSKIQSGTYKKTMRCFFFQSRLFEAQITELFDDLWPTVTAIKNLRWQVNGYYHEMGVKQNDKLARRFVESDDKTNRPNLYRACIEQSWEQQEFRISRNLLTNMFALYEGWIEMILPLLCGDKSKARKFQYPNYARATLVEMQHQNAALVDAFYDVYREKNCKSQLEHLENYLLVYRYFKECRNSIIHNGGKVVDQTPINAYHAVAGLTKEDLDVAEFPEMSPITAINEQIRLSLRGVVGFSQIVMKLVEVLAMEFIKAEKAVDCFVSQVKEFSPYPEFLSPNKSKYKSQIDGIMRRSAFLPPVHSDAFYQLLKSTGIVNM